MADDESLEDESLDSSVNEPLAEEPLDVKSPPGQDGEPKPRVDNSPLDEPLPS